MGAEPTRWYIGREEERWSAVLVDLELDDV
jgi:hypothetical protein